MTLCDTALAAAGGRDSPAAADNRRVPNLGAEAQARSLLGSSVAILGGEWKRGLKLKRQTVALMRRVVRETTSSDVSLDAKRG